METTESAMRWLERFDDNAEPEPDEEMAFLLYEMRITENVSVSQTTGISA
ncbi:MAG: hypothetical protein IJV14_10280 [Lachnospiraceae bacterium]|nr:hypothetical protein [Lachnospiraceae bacterium]